MTDAAVTYRIVAGRVDADGKKVSGEGFESSSEGNGIYHITFRPSFDALYGCSVALIGFPDGHNDTRDNALPYSIEDGSMHVATGDSQGSCAGRCYRSICTALPNGLNQSAFPPKLDLPLESMQRCGLSPSLHKRETAVRA